MHRLLSFFIEVRDSIDGMCDLEAREYPGESGVEDVFGSRLAEDVASTTTFMFRAPMQSSTHCLLRSAHLFNEAGEYLFPFGRVEPSEIPRPPAGERLYRS